MKACLNIIKKIIKPLYLIIRKRLQEVRWYCQYLIAKYQGLYPHKLCKLELDTEEKIIILVPHADDEWIGPYSIIKQRISNLHCVYFNLFGDNYGDENINRRNSEIYASSCFWGYKLINNYNYDAESLYGELLTSKYCFLPSPYDWHPEHRKVFQTFMIAYNRLTLDQRRSLEVYYYCVSVPHFYKLHQYYIPLTKQEIDDKWRLFPKVYHSQAFMPSLRYKLQLRLVPSQIGYAAQMFVKANENTLSEDFARLDNDTVLRLLSNLSGKINNIAGIRKADVVSIIQNKIR